MRHMNDIPNGNIAPCMDNTQNNIPNKRNAIPNITILM